MGGQHNASAALPRAKRSGSQCTEVLGGRQASLDVFGEGRLPRDLIHGPPS